MCFLHICTIFTVCENDTRLMINENGKGNSSWGPLDLAPLDKKELKGIFVDTILELTFYK